MLLLEQPGICLPWQGPAENRSFVPRAEVEYRTEMSLH